MEFDWKAVLISAKSDELILTLGYNTAIFNLLNRVKGQINIINMDGIEWKRKKWGCLAKSWFWLNERAACLIGNHLIADHPRIKEHIETRTSAKKITMIPYGGDIIRSANEALLSTFELEPEKFSTVIARPEPENSPLEIVRAFSQKIRNHKLVVLGNFSPRTNPFHKRILESASNEVIFPGAIYDSATLQALRWHSRIYIHGHQVGGTNPSLVEALGASCAILAHDNVFNRWVAGCNAAYFSNEQECSNQIERLLLDNELIQEMKASSKKQLHERFTWENILAEYETLLSRWIPEEENSLSDHSY